MTDKIAVVTGAGQGAGQAIAEKLAHGGVKVVLVGRTAEKVNKVGEKIGSGAVPYTLDVTQSLAVDEFARTLHDQFDHIDILVNCAVKPSSPRLTKVQRAIGIVSSTST